MSCCLGCGSLCAEYAAPHDALASPQLPPVADLYTSAPKSSALLSREVRFAGRAVYTGAPAGDMAIFGDGRGTGISVVYRGPGRNYEDLQTEFVLEQTHHLDPDSTPGLYRRVLGGFRWLDPYEGVIETFVCIGASYNVLEVSGDDALTGFGLYVGIGGELKLGRAASTYLEAMVHNLWGDEDSGGNGQAFAMAFGLGFRF